MSRKWLRWLIGVVVVLVVALVGGPFVYIHFIEADPPPPLTIPTTGTTTTLSSNTARAALAGTWKVTNGSTAGYRVNEVLFGQDNVATGRTSAVSGTMTIAGTTVQTTTMSVDLTTVKSDRSQRDEQFQGRIMNTAQFPTVTFKLTKPIALGAAPADGSKINVNATGDLTLHGTTRSVTIPLQALRNGNTIEVSGSINIVFANYGIDNPSNGLVTTQDHGIMEFLLVLSKE